MKLKIECEGKNAFFEWGPQSDGTRDVRIKIKLRGGKHQNIFNPVL